MLYQNHLKFYTSNHFNGIETWWKSLHNLKLFLKIMTYENKNGSEMHGIAKSGPWQWNFVDAHFPSVPHVSDRLELHNNNWASWIESDVYNDVIQEAQWNDLLHTARLDTLLHGNNARGAKYAVYYASVATHTVFENIKWLRSELCRIRNVAVPSLACLFPGQIQSSPKWEPGVFWIDKPNTESCPTYLLMQG